MNDFQTHDERALASAERHKAAQAAKEEAKQARLKAALRDNLRRRKQPRQSDNDSEL